jgi:hypothetical protein
MRKVIMALAIGAAALTLTAGTANATIIKPKCPITNPSIVGWGTWEPVGGDVFGHKGCLMNSVQHDGWDVTYIVCPDGFMETS